MSLQQSIVKVLKVSVVAQGKSVEKDQSFYNVLRAIAVDGQVIGPIRDESEGRDWYSVALPSSMHVEGKDALQYIEEKRRMLQVSPISADDLGEFDYIARFECSPVLNLPTYADSLGAFQPIGSRMITAPMFNPNTLFGHDEQTTAFLDYLMNERPEFANLGYLLLMSPRVLHIHLTEYMDYKKEIWLDNCTVMYAADEHEIRVCTNGATVTIDEGAMYAGIETKDTTAHPNELLMGVLQQLLKVITQ